MQAHILCHFIKNEEKKPPIFPFLGVTISGGHTQLILVEDYFKMTEIGTTLDDAIGEAFDKCGKKMGLDYPAGPEIDKLARNGNPDAFKFPIPKVKHFDVSYSGVKTAFLNLISKNINKNPNFIKDNLNDLCASIQKTLVEIIMNKIEKAKISLKINRVVIGGGVAANSEIRRVLNDMSVSSDWEVFIPSIEYTTDNAAMIGIAAYYKLKKNQLGKMNQSVNARLVI
jgi:N6-L-threonylcarbamoyladenine synthase